MTLGVKKKTQAKLKKTSVWSLMRHTCKLLCLWVKQMKRINQLTAPHDSFATLWRFNLQKTRHILRYSSEPDNHLVVHTVRFTYYIIGGFILELKKKFREHRLPPSNSFPKAIVYVFGRESRFQLPLAGSSADPYLSYLEYQRSKSLWILEHYPNLMSCSLAHCQHFMKTSLKSIHNFSSYFAKRQTKHTAVTQPPKNSCCPATHNKT